MHLCGRPSNPPMDLPTDQLTDGSVVNYLFSFKKHGVLLFLWASDPSISITAMFIKQITKNMVL
jgi:hypothetical protein